MARDGRALAFVRSGPLSFPGGREPDLFGDSDFIFEVKFDGYRA